MSVDTRHGITSSSDVGIYLVQASNHGKIKKLYENDKHVDEEEEEEQDSVTCSEFGGEQSGAEEEAEGKMDPYADIAKAPAHISTITSSKMSHADADVADVRPAAGAETVAEIAYDDSDLDSLRTLPPDKLIERLSSSFDQKEKYRNALAVSNGIGGHLRSVPSIRQFLIECCGFSEDKAERCAGIARYV